MLEAEAAPPPPPEHQYTCKASFSFYRSENSKIQNPPNRQTSKTHDTCRYGVRADEILFWNLYEKNPFLFWVQPPAAGEPSSPSWLPDEPPRFGRTSEQIAVLHVSHGFVRGAVRKHLASEREKFSNNNNSNGVDDYICF